MLNMVRDGSNDRELISWLLLESEEYVIRKNLFHNCEFNVLRFCYISKFYFKFYVSLLKSF